MLWSMSFWQAKESCNFNTDSRQVLSGNIYLEDLIDPATRKECRSSSLFLCEPLGEKLACEPDEVPGSNGASEKAKQVIKPSREEASGSTIFYFEAS